MSKCSECGNEIFATDNPTTCLRCRMTKARELKAKALKARIWRKEVSASMSGIEYCEPEATWLADAVAAINCKGERDG